MGWITEIFKGICDIVLDFISGKERKKKIFAVFYDVKTRRSVGRSVDTRIIYTKGSRVVHAVTSSIGYPKRKLVRFISKEDFYSVFSDIEIEEEEAQASN